MKNLRVLGCMFVLIFEIYFGQLLILNGIFCVLSAFTFCYTWQYADLHYKEGVI